MSNFPTLLRLFTQSLSEEFIDVVVITVSWEMKITWDSVYLELSYNSTSGLLIELFANVGSDLFLWQTCVIIKFVVWETMPRKTLFDVYVVDAQYIFNVDWHESTGEAEEFNINSDAA